MGKKNIRQFSRQSYFFGIVWNLNLLCYFSILINHFYWKMPDTRFLIESNFSYLATYLLNLLIAHWSGFWFFFPILFSHCVFDQWTKANELNRNVYLFTRDSRLNIRYDNAYIQIFSIIVRYEHNSQDTVRTCSTWATLRPKMFGMGDFRLKIMIIIKIESHLL